MRLFFLLICLVINNQLNAKSPGWSYHDNVRKAQRIINMSNQANYDSAFYYYDQALALETNQYDHNLLFIVRALYFGDYDLAKRYLLKGAAHNITWDDAKYAMSWAKDGSWWIISPRLNEKLNRKSKIEDVCSKAEFEAVYDSATRPALNTEILKILNKADRINNKSREREAEELIERDYQVYCLLYRIVVWLERIPTVAEVGVRGHGIIGSIIKRCSAIQILRLLPFLMDAIHNGTYLYNESLAEAIDHCAVYDGEFIVLKGADFIIEKDTLYSAEKWGNYSYLGYDYSRNKLDFVKESYVQPLRHTDITLDQVNNMRDTLCLDSIQVYLELNKIKQLKPYLFEENMDSLNANK